MDATPTISTTYVNFDFLYKSSLTNNNISIDHIIDKDREGKRAAEDRRRLLGRTATTILVVAIRAIRPLSLSRTKPKLPSYLAIVNPNFSLAGDLYMSIYNKKDDNRAAPE